MTGQYFATMNTAIIYSLHLPITANYGDINEEEEEEEETLY